MGRSEERTLLVRTRGDDDFLVDKGRKLILGDCLVTICSPIPPRLLYTRTFFAQYMLP
jgi:hypothetical protein